MISMQTNLRNVQQHREERQMIISQDFSNREQFVNYISALTELVPKDDFIVELCRDKSVLDLGCIDHSYQMALERKENWLHARIRNASKETVGLDILKEDAGELNKKGFHIVVDNVETFNLNRTFDVVVAGDLIEHLSNVGLFLEAVSRHMHPSSLFVITTPNPFNVEQFAQALFRNKIYANPEHTAWIDPRVMHQIISRSPLQIVDFKWIETKFKFRLKGGRVVRRLINPVSEMIMKKRPICRRDFAVILKLKDNE